MFKLLHKQKAFQAQLKDNRPLQFVDLGSGDGRIVFQAYRQAVFHKSVGYEINPFLHAWANARRFMQGPMVWRKTAFFCRDLWKVDLTKTNVVAVVSSCIHDENLSSIQVI